VSPSGLAGLWFYVCKYQQYELKSYRGEVEMPVSGVASAKAVSKASILPCEEIIFGRSAAMQPIRQMVGKILATDLPVLIQGENGTGKGLLAQYIHSRSKFASGACIKVNCAAIPGTLLESELFGYEKGAFTDAHGSKPGYVEMADNGTLFLDEISDLDMGLQAKTLQLLQDGHYSRIGDNQERRVNTRVICATNRKLEGEIAAGRFRQVVFYRINVVTLNLPPLRERREDIPGLANYFLEQLNARFEREAPPFPEDVVEAFTHKEWRGNIRELENLVARYAIMGVLDGIAAEPRLKRPTNPTRLSVDGTVSLKHIAKQAVREMESNVILQVLRENKWNRRKAANVLNISYRALIYKIQEAGLAQRHHRKAVPAPVDPAPATGLPD
jgi:transcriptional regulator with PAS, ATPase and Fis domain